MVMRMMVFYADTHHVGFMLQFQQTLYCVPMLTVFSSTQVHFMYISTLLGHMHVHTYMWQSQVEIEHYSVAYFAHITAFEAL